MKRSLSALSVAGIPDEGPRENPEPGRSNMLGADLRRPRRRLSTGPGLGWAEPEPSNPGVPWPSRPTTLPLLIPPRISITRADR
ncbi:Rho Gtpase-Activating Protein 31 [Manis pentadactyla]|nr:Rho Gtpase-Activating Protein 31 [Manis pentadactyla]